MTFEEFKREFLSICEENNGAYVSDDDMLEFWEDETEPYDAYYEMFGEEGNE